MTGRSFIKNLAQDIQPMEKIQCTTQFVVVWLRVLPGKMKKCFFGKVGLHDCRFGFAVAVIMSVSAWATWREYCSEWPIILFSWIFTNLPLRFSIFWYPCSSPSSKYSYEKVYVERRRVLLRVAPHQNECLQCASDDKATEINNWS